MYSWREDERHLRFPNAALSRRFVGQQDWIPTPSTLDAPKNDSLDQLSVLWQR
jgi:hypothetical protein